MANVFTHAKKLQKKYPKKKWQDLVKMAGRELRSGPAKKSSVSGTKKKTTKVTIKAKNVRVGGRVAGIGCTSSTALKEMNACIAGIERAQKQGQQLTDAMLVQPVKVRVVYRKEIAKNRQLIQSLTKKKNELKKLI